MNVSVFDLFKLGVGPSSSHTMGPMTAAGRFLARLGERVERTARIEVTLYASLALTGRGHATDRAVILGLAGFEPRMLDPDAAEREIQTIRADRQLRLAGGHAIAFDEARDLKWEGRTRLPQHPNALRFAAFDADGAAIAERTYFSIGGGFVRDEDEMGLNTPPEAAALMTVPYPFESGAELMRMADVAGLTFADIMRANERARRTDPQIDAGLDEVAGAMYACIERGMGAEGVLPGGPGEIEGVAFEARGDSVRGGSCTKGLGHVLHVARGAGGRLGGLLGDGHQIVEGSLGGRLAYLPRCLGNAVGDVRLRPPDRTRHVGELAAEVHISACAL